MANSLKFGLVLCLLGSLFGSQAAAECQATPFACAVDDAIENGLQALRNVERNQGHFGDNNARHNFLGALSFMEKRDGIGWIGRSVGFDGMDPVDQAMLIRLVQGMITNEGALTNPNANIYTYVTGGDAMALSAYLATGGPDDVGAPVTASQALANAVVALQRGQGADGGFAYSGPGEDISTTQFGIAGLSAAENIIAGAAVNLPNATQVLVRAQNADGGTGYRPNNDSSSSMTASSLWCYRLALVPAADPRAQQAMAWLTNNYAYDRVIGGGFAQNSPYYYLWAAEKALTVSTDDGLGGAIYADSFGERNPAALGYQEEPPSHYFDFAYTLLDWQDAAGNWGTQFNGSPRGWDQLSSHGFALLTLERSLGGVCLDVDDDGLCGIDDNCPELPNPDQADEDEDGVGDACDNCPKVVNRGQDDTDNDGIGDACDRYLCVPDGSPEVCDGIDNDCDNLIDVLPDGSSVVDPEGCGTGLPGQCSAGHLACSAAGQIACRADTSPSEEICDLLDNDCDGSIDEGLLNACGTCGPLPEERCDGIDNNCNGEIDEQPGRLCGGTLVCLHGECTGACGPGNSCDDDQFCTEGRCVSLCAGVECRPGETCDAGTGLCGTGCEDVQCGEGEACSRGECVDDNCYEAGCEFGFLCRDSACVEDPCRGVDCGSGSFCREGQCVFSCVNGDPTRPDDRSGISCGFGQLCIDGQCEDVRCGGVICADGQACADGQCVVDECVEEDCGPGRTCIGGACSDDPCNGIRCPTQQACAVHDGLAQCVADWTQPQLPTDDAGVEDDAGPEADAGLIDDSGIVGFDSGPTGGADSGTGQETTGQDDEGCSCDIGTDRTPSPALLFLLLGLPLAVRRRRRR